RPALLAGRQQAAGPRLRPAGRVRRRAGRHRALVRPAPGLVGAAQAAGRGDRGRAGPVSRWLVTGAGGMLGRDLVSLLDGRGTEVAALRHTDLDITDADAVHSALRHWQPAVLVNCAAW